ncbi:ABC transporter permease [Rhizobium pusense]|uniref:ABC transporter permease n=4 Tax=Agrobacterium TaxID=357 RepID=A0A1S9E6X8_9HYPH|nr:MULTISPECIES: ABC transporter permease [Rhizobium/Agrobacterium group]ANV23677.1 iron ABC transporter permease [Rhizobium sp. S41]AUC10473.1 iron ABC transporter permease [Rhizobium sp. Y9]KGE81997.1 iron ABC transporter permease [Rhizobium sp. H41]KIV67557.1 Petrobactin ABC transporter, permease protein I [Rhizobium sp. UR51a]MBA8797278.1 iron complex transport system permease protein [Agrobacterium sp. RC10-4-1]MBB2907122.1 iron complex transport system permease protein [Rhizobium sp. RA
MKSLSLILVLLLALVLAITSLFVGVSNVSLATLFAPDTSADALRVLLVSRIPRTLALILAGSSMAIAGLIMQMLVRNRFVEPSTAGTTESAGLGLLAVTLLAPDTPIFGKMLVAAAFALAGTALFLRILRQVPLRDVLLVPLIGIMLGGVISAVTTFFAYRFDLLQSLGAWMTGDFSGVLRGRYELLWIGFLFAIAAYLAADRFTVAGMGRDFTTNLGLNYRRVMALGLTIVSLVSAVVVVTVGMIPFLGLIVPNVVSLMIGDNMRRSVPWVATLGAVFVLSCDIIGRTVRAPYEIPIGTVVGVIGSALFLYLLLRKRNHA